MTKVTVKFLNLITHKAKKVMSKLMNATLQK